MPAIQTARLRQQSALLADHFTDPPAYIRSLHHLLNFYADRAKRPGKSGQPGPLIKAYQVHPPVLKLILQELVPLAQNDPVKGFELCDTLWREDYLEFRLLASLLVGQMPAETAEKVIGRIENWITPDLGLQLIDTILTNSLVRLRRERTNFLVEVIQSWLDRPENLYRQLGLRALLPLIRDREFENIPAFFGMLQGIVEKTPRTLRPDILEILSALVNRSPQETAYFLRRCLKSTEAIDTAWLIRQMMDQFPSEIQEGLRHSMRNT